MKKWKILFVGVGSIAKRHIKNIVNIIKKRNDKIQIDVLRSGKGNDLEDDIKCFISSVYNLDSQVPGGYDIVFITNPTQFHIEAIIRFHDKGLHFFIEKPLCMATQTDLSALCFREESIYYVAAPLRYNSVIQYIKENICHENILSVRCISSSYLPEWRQGIDYRNTYSAYRNMGGGVSIDLIHEWDYLTYLFGFPEKVKCIFGKKSKLEIDSDDIAIYIAEYKDKTTEIHLDYFGQKTIREIMIFTDNDTIIGDIANNEIIFLKTGKRILFNETRNDYQKRELYSFLDMISGKIVNHNNISHALEVLKLTQGEL